MKSVSVSRHCTGWCVSTKETNLMSLSCNSCWNLFWEGVKITKQNLRNSHLVASWMRFNLWLSSTAAKSSSFSHISRSNTQALPASIEPLDVSYRLLEHAFHFKLYLPVVIKILIPGSKLHGILTHAIFIAPADGWCCFMSSPRSSKTSQFTKSELWQTE